VRRRLRLRRVRSPALVEIERRNGRTICRAYCTARVMRKLARERGVWLKPPLIDLFQLRAYPSGHCTEREVRRSSCSTASSDHAR
jgi:hypothetical protein